MMHKCEFCMNNYEAVRKVATFDFPKDEELKKKWIDASHWMGFVTTKQCRVCFCSSFMSFKFSFF